MSSAVSTPKTDTVKLTINGLAVEVPHGTTILEAAKAREIEIPTLCYLKKLNPIGSCRVCSVEVEGTTGPVMSCNTPVVEGMGVTTDSDKIAKFRQDMIRFILVNHPLDCPVCERSGECSLQDRTFDFHVKEQTFFTTDHQKVKMVDWGVLRYDQNLCIMCERCVRICDEVQGVTALKIDGLGNDAKINTQDGEPLDCDFCGQCLSICPVGALNSGIVFNARSWELTKTESVCPHCAVGCSYHVDVKNNIIARISSNDDIGINTGNLCARGRFGFEAYQSNERLKTPLIRTGVDQVQTSWEVALAETVDKLKAIKETNGPDSVAVIASEKITNEDAYLLQKVMRAGLGVNRIETLSNMRNGALNAGLFDKFGASAPVTSYEEIEKAGCFVAFGCDMEKENPVIANMARMVMRDKGTNLYVANSRNVAFSPDPKARVRYEYGSEALLVSALISAKGKALKEAAKVSGVDEGAITALADAIKNDGAPLIFIGKEICDHPRSVDIVSALLNLANELGGSALLYREYSNSQGVNDMGLSSENFPGYLKVADKTAVSHFSDEWGVELDTFKAGSGDIFGDLAVGKIKGLLVVGVDPATHYPDGQFALDAMANADFVAVTESFVTETTRLANVVLPSAITVEKNGTFTNNEGRPQVVRQAVTPVGESRAEWEIFNDIGTRFGMKLSYDSASDITCEIAETVKGYEKLTMSKLAWGDDVVNYPAKRGKTSKLKFDASHLVLPDMKKYPYIALTGNTLFHLDSLSRASEALNNIEPQTFVEVSPEDAEREKIADGEEVLVESSAGSIKAVAHVTERSPGGVLFMSKCFENRPALSLMKRGEHVLTVRFKKVRSS
ncbi:NADH-ubiquinone oxidoreductase chain G [hydrothermal vent metagenome]|uniref:NADH-ubiquinone oxidoreductase chain G n=1 Tax=hydrothermal vent metagenome TaxID=652676 RepID=A0A3B1CRL1_9ZZZZ